MDVQPQQEKKVPVKQEVTENLNEALNPDMVDDWKSFQVRGETFQIRPLVFKWDQLFRRYALPILGAGLQPVEMLIAAAIGGTASYKVNLGISNAIVASEIEVDELLPNALGAVCAAQDRIKGDSGKTSKMIITEAIKYWAECISEEMQREEISDLVEEQMNIQKALQSLGKSLSTRFENLAKLVDSKNGLNLSSLLPSLTVPALKPLESAGKSESTQSSSSGSGSGARSQTGTRTARVKL